MPAVCCCITNSIKALNSSQSTAPKLKIILHAYAQTYARTDGDTGQKDNATNATGGITTETAYYTDLDQSFLGLLLCFQYDHA